MSTWVKEGEKCQMGLIEPDHQSETWSPRTSTSAMELDPKAHSVQLGAWIDAAFETFPHSRNSDG